MNKVIMIGYLAADPEFNSTQSGVSRCTFRIATQRRFANAEGKRESDFFNCIAWRNTADFISRFFAKGSRIAIEGTLQNRSYDAQDGSKDIDDSTISPSRIAAKFGSLFGKGLAEGLKSGNKEGVKFHVRLD